MKPYKQIIKESKQMSGTGSWKHPTLKDVRDSATSLHDDDVNYHKTYKSITDASVKKIPHSFFKKEDNFRSYTKKELNSPDLEPRVKRIVKGFKDKTIPMILGTQDKKTKEIDIHDGRTRAAVAIGLGHPIYAKIHKW